LTGEATVNVFRL